jgi:hypothetical protein
MEKVSLVFLLFFAHTFCKAQAPDDTLQSRIILIGDAGQLNSAGRHPVISSIKNNMKLDAKTTIVYLGDNLYRAGLPDSQSLNYSSVRAILDSEVNIARGSGAKVYFIPGNHDWDEFGAGGWEAVRRQQAYINLLGDKNVNFFPEDGCPGPKMVDLTDEVVLIMMDSQWWVHKYDKPGIESDCPFKTKIEVINELENLLNKNSKKLVILATHHPLKSNGIHGGYFPAKLYLFPLLDFNKKLYIPIPIGPIYPIVRGVYGTPQDMRHPNYANMITDIERVAKNHPNTIFVAGHEHNQQLIKDSGYYYIVSGSASKETRVSKRKNSLFASDTTGFATLEISNNKNVKAAFYSVTDDKTVKSYSGDLLNFSKQGKPKLEDSVRIVYVPYNADSITVSANPKYARASGLKQFLNGKNYRKEWATPVKMKIFYLNKMGFTIESLGGGKQTKTLTLKDKRGKEWILKTIDKDLEYLLPADFQGTAAENYVRDFVSSAHPYGALIVPPLAKAANLVVASPKLYFVPNDNAFDIYRPLFANKVVMLEEKVPTADGSDTRSTGKTLNEMIEDNEHHVDQEVTLRARLLDLFIADWDRHFDQWKFGKTDTGKGKLYYPVPRDRDAAFSFSDGLFMKWLSTNTMPYLRGFKKEIDGAKWLSYLARDFDRLFLNHLDEAAWKKSIAAFQEEMTDQVIHEAVLKLPPEVYSISGPLIEEKLKNRRDLLMKEGLDYYKFLSKEVDVVGSNQKEYFRVSQLDGQLQVRVYKRKRAVDSVSVMYDRKFDSKVTDEIRFYGLSGDDLFEVDEDVSSDIKLRIIGGRKEDTFNIKGNARNFLYDLSTENNYILQGNKSKVEFSPHLEVNEYSTTGFQYDRVRVPIFNVGYNVEDGLLAGVGFNRRTYGFRKQPYSTDQRFSSLYAFSSGAYQLRYRGDFSQVLGKTGLAVKADVVKPVLNNFFGLGNRTKYNSTLKQEFYRVRYNYASLDALFTKRVNALALIMGAGPHIYHYWNNPEDNQGKILNFPSLIGLDSLSIYKHKTYVGAKAFALFSTLNDDFFPTRGVYWNTQLTALAALNNGKPFTSLTSDLTLYSSFKDPAKLVTVVRLGGGHIYSKNYEYFQAMNLGQNNVLRGFRKNRFSGRSMAYVSFETRYKLFDTKSYILPGAVGFIAFGDLGRVWIRDEVSKNWHFSYGTGLYYSAYNAVLLSATVGFSKEESLFNFTIGSKFNLNF